MQLARRSRIQIARGVGQGERSLHDDARHQRCQMLDGAGARLAIAQDVSHRRQRGEQGFAVAGERRLLLQRGDAEFGGARQIGDHRVAHQRSERAQFGRAAHRFHQASAGGFGDGGAVNQLLDQLHRELRLPS